MGIKVKVIPFALLVMVSSCNISRVKLKNVDDSIFEQKVIEQKVYTQLDSVFSNRGDKFNRRKVIPSVTWYATDTFGVKVQKKYGVKEVYLFDSHILLHHMHYELKPVY